MTTYVINQEYENSSNPNSLNYELIEQTNLLNEPTSQIINLWNRLAKMAGLLTPIPEVKLGFARVRIR